MKLKHLQNLTSEFPECHFVGLADMSSGIVLSSSANIKPRQERLDQLCELATTLFETEFTQSVSGALKLNNGDGKIRECQIVGETSVVWFFRSGLDPKEVMFCSGSKNIDIDAFSENARKTASGQAPD